MTITWSALAPHPPIILQEIGLERCLEVNKTITSMKALAQDFIKRKCDLLIVLSPHTYRPSRGICTWSTPNIKGDFSPFGHPELNFEIKNDCSWITSFIESYPATHFINDEKLDHGALVPLSFFIQAGWSGPTVVLGLPWNESEHSHIARAIIRNSKERNRIGLLASGDMSHCLKRGAPSGYDPAGAEFDNAFALQVENGNFNKALSRGRKLRTDACEDVVGSCEITWNATHFNHTNHKFYSYEGPFGVGYTVARFHVLEDEE